MNYELADDERINKVSYGGNRKIIYQEEYLEEMCDCQYWGMTAN